MKGKRGVRGFRVEYINLCPSVWSNATVPPVHHVHSVHIRLSCDHKIHHERPRNCRRSIQGDENVHKSLAEVNFSVHLSGYHNCDRHSERISGEGICRIGNLAIFRHEGGGGSGHFVNCENRLIGSPALPKEEVGKAGSLPALCAVVSDE